MTDTIAPDTNPFVLPKQNYARDIAVIRHYVNDAALYMSKMTNKSVEECEAFVRTQLRAGGQFEFKDPTVHYLERKPNGDRVKAKTTLSNYINDAVKNGELIAPTLTTYLPASKVPSLLVDFIDTNVKKRGVAKKAQFKAKMAGDKATETLKKGEQTTYKLGNNSISGAHVSASTPLFNRTAHSTLTSNCRSTSGYGNANNEKFLCGNRHYWKPDIVRANIISIINHSDYNKIDAAMKKFGIRPPTVSETMDCIKYSAKLYWHGDDEYQRIELLVSKLTDLERAAFVYTGDLYHLRKFNEGLVRDFIDRLSKRVTDKTYDDPELVIHSVWEDCHHLATQICCNEMRGKTFGRNAVTGLYEVAEGDKNKPALEPEDARNRLMIVTGTIENIHTVLNEYWDLIRAFWVTPNIPASVAVFPDSIRRAAVTSDTDSTIFTVQEWVKWSEGRICFDDKAMGVGATMIFLAAQTITHVLARMSANFGIEQKRLHQIAMKNEFYFPVFVPTQVAKHYYAKMSVQEGNVFGEMDMEIKGVHLKSSNAPKEINDEAKKMMDFIMTEVMAERPISINRIMTWIADIERNIIDSIKKGGYSFFRKGQIKTPSSYIDGEEATPYVQYLLWRDCFAPKYGEIPEPPYMSVKISADLSSPAKTKAWLNKIQDKDMVQRIELWMARNNKKHMGTAFMLPEQSIQLVGIPEEILAAMDLRKIVLDTTKVFYLILETLNVYMLNDKLSRMCSDTH
jgi:hypothetical protein